MQILYVVDKLCQRSGITAVVRNYLANIKQDNIKIDLIVQNDSDQDIVDAFRKKHNVYFMPKLTMSNMISYINFWNNFFYEHHNYTLVHSHFNQIDYIVFKAAKKHGVRYCISHSHNTRLSDVKWKAIRNWVMCYPARRVADFWAACSELAGQALYGNSFCDSPKKVMIHNAINLLKFKFEWRNREIVRDKYHLTGDEVVIGTIGRFKTQKNKMFLIKISKELARRGVPFSILNIGDGELMTEFVHECNRQEQTDNIINTGLVKNPEKYLSAMDVFILPSLYEGLPVVGIEAQANELPCVFSDIITREVDVLSDSNRYINLGSDITVWVDSLIVLSRMRQKMIQDGNAMKKLKDHGFEISDAADKLCNFYMKLANGKN